MKQVSLNQVWIINSLFIAIISWLTSYYNLSSHLYLTYNFIYVFFILLLSRMKIIFKNSLNPLSFFLGTFFLLIVMPIFEDDFYRYAWEGKVLLSGFNPYQLAPNSEKLLNINFVERDLIGFKDLTTIYPPFALLIFSISSAFSASAIVALKILGILNAIIVFFLLKLVKIECKKKYLLFLILPMLAKEFINSVHIDLMASFFIFTLMFKKHSSINEKIILISLSFLTKVMGILYLVPLIIKSIREDSFKNTLYLIFIPFLIVISYFIFVILNDTNGGSVVFVKHWVWNAGFFSLLWRNGVTPENSRIISLGILIVFVTSMVFYSYSNSKNTHVKDNSFELALFTLLFCIINFFMPVYNTWYAIWIAIPGILLGNLWVVFYSCFSFLGYTFYAHESFVPFAEIFTHLWFFPSVISLIMYLNNLEKIR